jgi:hypothetical protein
MNIRKITLLSALITIFVFQASAVKLDKGGVTFDFQKISDSRMKIKQNLGPNIISNGNFKEDALKRWKIGGWYFNAHASRSWFLNRDKAKISEIIKVARQNVFGKIVHEDDDNFATIKRLKALRLIYGAKTVRSYSAWVQTISVPPASSEGRYRLQIKYRGTVSNVGFVILFLDDSGKKAWKGKATGKLLSIKPPAPTREWTNYIKELMVPANTARIILQIRVVGIGKTDIKNVSLCKLREQKPVTVKLAPMAFLDNVFCLSEQNPAIMCFSWRRNIPKDKLNLKDPIMHLTLPVSMNIVKLVGGPIIKNVRAVEINNNKYRHYELDMHKIRKRPKILNGYDVYGLIGLLMTSTAKAGTEFKGCSYWIEDKSVPVSNRETFTMKVIPKISNASKPTHFMNGFFCGGRYMRFRDTKSQEIWTKFIGNTGCQWLIDRPNKKMAALYRANGIKMITPELYYIANGYRIGTPKNKPEYAKFKGISKKSNLDSLHGTCPTSIYKKTEYWKQNVVPYLSQLKDEGYDGLWANWEPWTFTGNGCFCEKCREEFATFSKLPLDTVKKMWPQEVLGGRKYNAQWIRFRSWQHARVVKTLNEEITRITSGKAGFIPGVSWVIMSTSKEGVKFGEEHTTVDYGSNFKYINTWGPYPHWDALVPYFYRKVSNLYTYIAGGHVRKFTDKNFPAGKRPKLLGLPHGNQLQFWLTQPEAITMDVLSLFIQGYYATAAYHFPRGYDNRYWNAMAKANKLIAQYEDFVFNGQEFSGITVKPHSPYPSPAKELSYRWLPDDKNIPLLQVKSYKLDNRLLVAVGNFWEKANVFFMLQVKGLERDKKYVVVQTDKKRYFRPENAPVWTGQDLAKGVLLHAGALRWEFFTIKPFQKDHDYGEQVLETDLQRAKAKFIQEIRAMYKFEEKLSKTEKTKNKLSKFKKMSNGPLSCFVDKNHNIVNFVSGNNSLQINARGMNIKNWLNNENDIVAGYTNYGFGTPAFVVPSRMFNKRYNICKIEKINSGISITGEYLVPKNDPLLKRMLIRQTITVFEKCDKIKIETILKNCRSAETGGESMNIAFRYHNLPSCLSRTGQIAMKNNQKDILLKREYYKKVFAIGHSRISNIAKAIFKVKVPIKEISSGNAILKGKNTVKMDLEPANQFAGFACWDIPSLKAPTFEPFFKEKTISPGQSLKYSMILTVIK